MKLNKEIEEVLILVIINGRYSLVKSIIDQYKLKFKVAFVNTALENNRNDIVFLLKLIYLRNYVKYERSYISSLTLSFERSNTKWLAKMHLLTSLIEQINYIKA